MLRTAIRPLIRWRPLPDPEPGYSVVIGCKSSLAGMLGVNLQLLGRQRRDHLREVIVVWDCGRSAQMIELEARLRSAIGDLPVRFLYYSPLQVRVTSAIQWGWVYSWLSWCAGLSIVRTRYVPSRL